MVPVDGEPDHGGEVMPLRDPFDGHCVPDADPRLSEADRLALIGEQYTSSRYVVSLDQRPEHTKCEVWAGPHKLPDQHAARVLATALRMLSAP